MGYLLIVIAAVLLTTVIVLNKLLHEEVVGRRTKYWLLIAMSLTGTVMSFSGSIILFIQAASH